MPTAQQLAIEAWLPKLQDQPPGTVLVIAGVDDSDIAVGWRTVRFNSACLPDIQEAIMEALDSLVSSPPAEQAVHEAIDTKDEYDGLDD